MKRKGGMRRERRKSSSFYLKDYINDNEESVKELQNQRKEYQIRMKEAAQLLKETNETLGVLLDIQKKPCNRVLVLSKNLVKN